MKATIVVPSDAQPQFFKPRPIPYALKQKVELELDRLQNEGVITPYNTLIGQHRLFPYLNLMVVFAFVETTK